MVARIYKPTRNAMQSGNAKTELWVLDYEPEQPRQVEPLMGYTSSGDMKSQLRLSFDTKEEAIAYAERHGIAFQVQEPKKAIAAQDRLFRQFQLPPHRPVDALSVRGIYVCSGRCIGPVAQLDRAAAF